jgi:hypothetical protein
VNVSGADAFKSYAADIENLYDVTCNANELRVTAYATPERDGKWTIQRIFSGPDMPTNITEEMRAAFNAVTSGRFDNFALFSCFLDGRPTAAITAVNREGDEYTIKPLFVFVTDEIMDRLADHDRRVPSQNGGAMPAGA